jgi:hypothetical protein
MGPLGRAVIAGLLAAAGVVFGISMEDLTYQGHRSTSIGTTSTAEPTTNVKRAVGAVAAVWYRPTHRGSRRKPYRRHRVVRSVDHGGMPSASAAVASLSSIGSGTIKARVLCIHSDGRFVSDRLGIRASRNATELVPLSS